jgi:hypothetical protein
VGAEHLKRVTSDEATPQPAVRAAVPAEAIELSTPHPVGLVVGPIHRLSAGEDVLGGQDIPAPTLDVLRKRSGQGDPLPAGVSDTMSPLLGADLSSVRMHTDGESQQLSRSLQAKAFTYGSDVYLGSDAYRAGAGPNPEILTHELAHVAQNATGRGGSGAVIGRADDPAEADADRAAHAALGNLQRMTIDSAPPSAPAADVPRLDALRERAAGT